MVFSDDNSFLLGVFIFLLVFAVLAGFLLPALLFALLRRLARKEAAIRVNRFVIQYGWAAKTAAWLGFLVMWFLVIWDVVYNFEFKLVPVVRDVACIGIFSNFLMIVYFWRVEFDEESLYVFSPLRRSRVIPWSEVTRCVVRSRLLVRWIGLETQKHGEIKFGQLLSGLGTLAKELNRRGIALEGNKTNVPSGTGVSGESMDSY